MNPGIKQSQFRIFLQSLLVLGSSKGRQPQAIAYRMMPLDHRSDIRPLYLFPAIISGAAQQGLPQAVFRSSPGLQVLERPKSTNLTLFHSSSKRFSGFKSLWHIPTLWMYSMPLMICWKNRTQSTSCSLFLCTMQSKSSPPDAYSIIRNNCLDVSIIQTFKISSYFIKLNDIWMSDYFQNMDLSCHSFYI